MTNGRFADIAHAGKVKILEGPLRADVGRVARLMHAALADDSQSPPDAYEQGIVQFIAAMPVYRTYVDGRTPTADPEDAAVVERTLERARSETSARPSMRTIEVIADLVVKPGVVSRSEETRDLPLAFVQRLQQTSGPATAKGVEDTALYIYVPLASRNEVGGAPDRLLDDAVGRLHRANFDRACNWPSALTCTNTHDTKRSADLRARLDVLSECASEWQRCFARWRRLNRRHRATVKGRLAPDTNTEYLLYQTLIGLWPSPRPGRRADDLPDRQWLDAARERVEQYMLKAVKEAKTRTSWTDPDEGYEQALKQFIAAVLTTDADSLFLSDVARFVSRVANAGYWNALSRLLVHLTAPGVPDTYQGDDLWLFALVDPDNRRPVDYARRTELLASIAAAGRLPSLHPSDERLKLGILQRLLHTRRANAALFAHGAYLPLEVRGTHARQLIAFARRDGEAIAIVVAPRLIISNLGPDGRPRAWEDTEIVLPGPLTHEALRSVLHDEEVPIRGDSNTIAAASVLSELPLALLLRP